ncbi:zinc finger protein 234-like [Culicoides brevitarsis]|uniref:zinc finger protein 234-like n=1 Tax=Culicoides brevitarsis TaxID=469753 RepID=UPI00307B1195
MFPIKSLIRGVNAVHLNKIWQNTGAVPCAFSTKKSQMELASIPPRPKRPLSPFFLYMFETRPKYASENPQLKAIQVSQELAKNWRELDASKKTRYVQEYEKEKQKYAVEITKYNSKLTPEMKESLQNARRKLVEDRARRVIKARSKDLGKPKRPLSGYMVFVTQMRSVDPKKSTEKLTEYVKRISMKWNKMSEVEKKPYLDEGDKKIAQYKIDLEKWEQRMIKEGNLDLVRKPFGLEETKPRKTKTSPTPKKRSDSSEVYGLFDLTSSNASPNLDLETLPDDLLGPVLTSIPIEIETQELEEEVVSDEKDRKSFKCGTCDEIFTSFSKLRTHRYKIHNEKQHMCDFCSKSFGLSADLRIHLRIHTGVKPFPCEFCPKRFTTSSSLRDHLKTHTGEKNWKCQQCPKAYARSSDLKVHFKTAHTTIRPYTCLICNKGFVIQRVLNEHMRTHNGTKFRCENCPKTFNLKSHLRIHQQQEHSMEPRYKCETCNLTFTKAIEQKRHMRQSHMFISRPFRCTQCPNRYANKENLEVHMETHRTPEKKKSQCLMCNLSFVKSTDFMNHLKQHEKALTCTVCLKYFESVETLQEHSETCPQSFKRRLDEAKMMKKTKNEKKLQEKIDSSQENEVSEESVDESSMNESQKLNDLPIEMSESQENIDEEEFLNDPILDETESVSKTIENDPKIIEKDEKLNEIMVDETKKIIKIPEEAENDPKIIENYEFNEKMDLDETKKTLDTSKSISKTLKNDEKPSETLMECNICSFKMRFSEKRFLHHFRKHFPPTAKSHPFECQTCRKLFTTASNLKVHQHVHNDSRDYLCADCPKKYARLSDLKVHMRTHTDERRFKCHLCPSAFRQSSVLSQHIRTHTNERPFVCQICCKAFKSSGTRSVHMRSHRNERKFVCDSCEKRFLTGSDLRKHQFLHSGQVPFECGTCARRFPFAGHLKKHEKSHTSTEKPACKSCGIKFATMNDLRRHNLDAHTFSCGHCDGKFCEKELFERHLEQNHEKF